MSAVATPHPQPYPQHTLNSARKPTHRVRERWVRTLFVEDKRKPYALIQVQLQQQHELFAEFQRLRRKPEPEAGEPPDADVLDTVAKVDSLAHALTWGVLLLCSANLIVSSQYLLAANRRWTYRRALLRRQSPEDRARPSFSVRPSSTPAHALNFRGSTRCSSGRSCTCWQTRCSSSGCVHRCLEHRGSSLGPPATPIAQQGPPSDASRRSPSAPCQDVMNLFRVTARGPRTQNLALSMLVKEPISFNVYKAPKPESDDDGHGDGA